MNGIMYNILFCVDRLVVVLNKKNITRFIVTETKFNIGFFSESVEERSVKVCMMITSTVQNSESGFCPDKTLAS